MPVLGHATGFAPARRVESSKTQRTNRQRDRLDRVEALLGRRQQKRLRPRAEFAPPPPDDGINSKGGGSPVRSGTVEGRRGRERGRGGEEEKRGTWIWMDALPAGARGGRPPDLRGEGGGRRIGGAGKLNHAARGRKDRERGRRTCSEQPGVNRAMVMEGGRGVAFSLAQLVHAPISYYSSTLLLGASVQHMNYYETNNSTDSRSLPFALLLLCERKKKAPRWRGRCGSIHPKPSSCHAASFHFGRAHRLSLSAPPCWGAIDRHPGLPRPTLPEASAPGEPESAL
jgi:hypothetical protein